MKKPIKITLGIALGSVFLTFFIIFFIGNVIIPEPYQKELNTCLDYADQAGDEAAVKSERNICFRTYPHFN